MSTSAFEAVRRVSTAGRLPLGRAAGYVGALASATARNTTIWALAVVALAAAIVATTMVSATPVKHAAPAFLARSLGAAAPAALLARVSAEGIRTAITRSGYSFQNGDATMTLASQDVASAAGGLSA